MSTPPLDSAGPAEPLPSTAELLARGDITGIMRACHERRLEREGIPMVLTLADERGTLVNATDDDRRVEGGVFADVLERYSAALTPWARDDDEGALITAMQVLAYTHFAPGAAPVTEEDAR